MLRITKEKSETGTVLHPQGRIVAGVEAQHLRRTVIALLDSAALDLDLARVSTIDAGGLGLLLEILEWTQRRKIKFRLFNVPWLIEQVLQITRLDSVFEVSFQEPRHVAIQRPPGQMRHSSY